MKKKLKELIENAPFKGVGTFTEFLLIPTNKEYDGFWGKNGYNNVIVLGYNKKEEVWCKVSYEQCDNMFISNIRNFNMDIPRDLGCIRIWFNDVIELSPPASSVIGVIKEKYAWEH